MNKNHRNYLEFQIMHLFVINSILYQRPKWKFALEDGNVKC